MKIQKASCAVNEKDIFDSGIVRKAVLPGEVNGIETLFVVVEGQKPYEYQPEEKRLKIFLFSHGEGTISYDELSIPVQVPCLFIPGLKREFRITGGKENLNYLEIEMVLTIQDLDILNKGKAHFPLYNVYSESPKYIESIKSEKTISRMILAEDIVPRLCIGSVETSGPDKVDAHTHPMLEQFFFGLKGNNAVVTADSAETEFMEDDLLHIPLGSSHGVSVEAGKALHYIWIDLFHSQEDMGYITDSHHIIND